MNADESKDLLRAKLNGETARLAWKELERHYARGVVIRVAMDQDLVEVALSFARDDRERVAALLESGAVARVSDAEALDWQGREAVLWGVVVAPWVLVQETVQETAEGLTRQ